MGGSVNGRKQQWEEAAMGGSVNGRKRQWEEASMGSDGVNHSQLWVKGINRELRADWAAYLTLVSAVLTLSMPAKCLAPSDPKLFEPTLKTMAIWRQGVLIV